METVMIRVIGAWAVACSNCDAVLDPIHEADLETARDRANAEGWVFDPATLCPDCACARHGHVRALSQNIPHCRRCWAVFL